MLPRPPYSLTGLSAFLEATGAPVPVPPGDPAAWTCLLAVFGPGLLLTTGDRGQERLLDADMLRALLDATGRPAHATEQDALLLVTPIPAIDGAQALRGLLRHGEYGVRQRAALSLGVIGDKTAVSALLARLDDDDNDVRRAAAESLGHLGDVGVALDLARRPWDIDTSVSCARLEAIDRLGAWEAAVGLLDRSSGDDLANLAAALAVAVEDGEVAELAEFLAHGDRDLQRVAARFFAGRPAVAAEALEPLIARLGEDGDEGVCHLIATACSNVGEDALEPLVSLLEASSWEARAHGCIALAASPALADAANDAIRARFDDSDDDVKREAALALLASGRPDARAESVVAALLATLRLGFLGRCAALADRLPVLRPAAMLLGRMPADVALLPFASDARADSAVRGVAAMLVALYQPALAAPTLIALARDDARGTPLDVRRAAAAALMLTGEAPGFLGAVHRVLLCHPGDSGSAGVGPIDGLVGKAGELAALASRDGDWQVRLDALRLLSQLGPAALVPYADLIGYMARHDPDEDVRIQAAALVPRPWRVASTASLLADACVPAHGASNDDQRVAAFRALADRDVALAGELARHFFRSDDRNLARAGAEILALTGAGGDLVALGVGRLEDANWIAREAACVLLGHLPLAGLGDGQLDEIAESLRVRAEEDTDSDVRSAATGALTRLGRPLPAAGDDEDADDADNDADSEDEEDA